MKAARPEPFDYAQESLVEGFVGATGWSPLVMIRLILIATLALITPVANALDALSLNVGTIKR